MRDIPARGPCLSSYWNRSLGLKFLVSVETSWEAKWVCCSLRLLFRFACSGVDRDPGGSRTNWVLIAVIKLSRTSAIRKQRWTSSTTLVRKALTVSFKRRSDTATSSSFPPRAKLWRSCETRATRIVGRVHLPSKET